MPRRLRALRRRWPRACGSGSLPAYAGRLAEFLETDHRLDGVAEHRLAGIEVAGEHGVPMVTAPLLAPRASARRDPASAIRVRYIPE